MHEAFLDPHLFSTCGKEQSSLFFCVKKNHIGLELYEGKEIIIFIVGLTILLKKNKCCLCRICCDDIIKLFSCPAPLISMASTSRRIWVPSSSPQSWWWIQSKEKCSKLQEEKCKSMRFNYC